jgi:hypothetical protein
MANGFSFWHPPPVERPADIRALTTFAVSLPLLPRRRPTGFLSTSMSAREAALCSVSPISLCELAGLADARTIDRGKRQREAIGDPLTGHSETGAAQRRLEGAVTKVTAYVLARGARKTMGTSVISSVIALEESENRRQ